MRTGAISGGIVVTQLGFHIHHCDRCADPGNRFRYEFDLRGSQGLGMHVMPGYRRQVCLLVSNTSRERRLATPLTMCRTPALMFQHENGTTQVVKQVGGMLAYYLLFANEGETIETFPEGFRMLAGDMNLRNFTGPVPDPEKSLWTDEDKTQLLLGQKAIGMNCLNYAKDPEPSMYRHFLPDKQYLDDNCVDGIRAESEYVAFCAE